MPADIFGLNRKWERERPSIFPFQIICRSLVIFVLFATPDLSAQNLVCHRYKADPVFQLDTLPVEAGSITLSPVVDFTFDAEKNTISLSSGELPDSIRICYRTISAKLYEPIFNRDIETYSRGGVHVPTQGIPGKIREDELFDFGQVDSYGAITRGITFGNRQNVFVNSALNLQMDGKLSEDLSVQAVITDQNIPYQPEGNTQQIRDFDNVFIKLYNEKFQVIAGDIVLRNPIENSYFLKYYKNVQGILLNYNYGLGNAWKARSLVTGSLAKGQFASAVIDPIEGVQGPYKLRGPNGERFIIVLANSERVFLDGKLLERGFDRDYVIDYNLGEITFSSDVVITRFSRIRTDYEYADQYYARTNVTAAQELTNGRSSVYFNYYREKDNPSSTLGFDLSDEDRMQLQLSGDNNGSALISGADSVGVVDFGIAYEKTDTIDLDGNPSIIYRFSTDERVAHYRVSFSQVGIGQGNYRLSTATANGKIFEWVSPVGGEAQGDYAPVRVVPTPNQRQMLVIGSRTPLSDYEEFFQELAVSSIDRNLYSSLDDGDNSGLAWKGGLSSKGRNVAILPRYTWNSVVSLESDHRNFSAIDRFRSVDFDRDWSYNAFTDSIGRADQILTAAGELTKDLRNAFTYEFNYRNRTNVIKGIQQELNGRHELGPFYLQSENFLLNNAPGSFRSEWLRSSQLIRLNSWKLNPGYQFSLDHHTTRLAERDSIVNTLMHFTSHNFFLETTDSARTHFRSDFILRRDNLPVMGSLMPYTDASEVRVGLNTPLFQTQEVGLQINYRRVRELIGPAETDTNILGRLDWSGRFLNDLFRSSLTYTTANSRELRREFVFLNVATGEGTHTWRDENGDGIQDLNEFYEAINVDEKNYIKLFTPTDEYLTAFQTTYVHTVDARFPASWTDRGAFLATIGKLSANASIRYNFKTTDDHADARLNPFGSSLIDEQVLSVRNLNRYTLFYNRNAPGLGMDLMRTEKTTKSLLSGGFEWNKTRDWSANFRFGFGPVFTIRLNGTTGQTFNASDFLISRNFDLKRNIAGTELVWQPLNTLRITTGLESRFRNTLDSEVSGRSEILEYHIETTWIRATRGNLNASFHWLNIDFEGPQNTFLGYELLEALQPGNNQRWRVNWQQSLRKGLQLTLQYHGRKSSGAPAVHTGTVQVTAFF